MTSTFKKYFSPEAIIIIIFSCIPLFSSYPYRINIFLSWEGAYRLYLGQLPYKDFGLPLGYAYWLIPALFFKIFGPYMITLIKAQVFINIVSGFAFFSILKSFNIKPYIRISGVLLYVISFSFFNFWPWYNHTVIVFEFIGLAFLFRFLLPEKKSNYAWLVLSGCFVFLSFFTKQDGGGLGLLVSLFLLAYHCAIHKKLLPLLVFIASYILFALLLIIPFLPYNFGYWFNHGQPPHNSRLDVNDLIHDLLSGSEWLKFYFLLFVIFLLPYLPNWKQHIKNEKFMLLLLLVAGIMVEALIFQFTSYIPQDNNIFFHSFCFVLLLIFFDKSFLAYKHKRINAVIVGVLTLFWWSGVFWKVLERSVHKIFPEKKIATTENVISRKTYAINPNKTDLDDEKWVYSTLPVFKHIYMPASTVNGMNRLMQNKNIHLTPASHFLNMTELTPLSYVFNIPPEKGSNEPLWYHLGVGMFNKQKDMYCKRINDSYYDLVLFEYIPTLNNFYPFAVRDSLQKHYQLVDTFLAPRRPSNATIEVYMPKN